MLDKNVVALPERPVREWGAIRRELSATLRELGHDDQMIERVCRELREPCLHGLSQEMIIDRGNGDDAVRVANIRFSNLVVTLMMHMANFVIENQELRRRLGMEG